MDNCMPLVNQTFAAFIGVIKYVKSTFSRLFFSRKRTVLLVVVHDNTLLHNSCISLRIEASSVKAPWPFLLRIADIVGSRGNGSERMKKKKGLLCP